MTKHFFTFRHRLPNRPQIDIEVIIAADISRSEARRIAEEEIRALRAGHEALRLRITKLEKTLDKLPDYRFLGGN